LRQGSHCKFAAVASRRQGVGDLIGSGFELYTQWRSKGVRARAPGRKSWGRISTLFADI